MQGLNKVFLAVGMLMLPGIILAQSSSPSAPPRDVSYPQPSGPGIPAGTAQPTVDLSSRAYLPWIGQNVGLLVNYADFFYQLQKGDASGGSSPYMAPITALANMQLVSMGNETAKKVIQLTMKNVQDTLAYGDESTMAASTYAAIPATDTVPPVGGILMPNIQFNADMILGTLGFDDSTSSDKELSPINALIMFLSGGAKPLGGLTFSTDADTRKKQLAGSDVQDYLLQSRMSAAGQSVAFSNLNYLAQERRIIKGLGVGGGMTTLPTDGNQKVIPDASQLQLEQFLVDRRVGNVSWYTNVNTASSITVQRETLFVLAEISKQMFQQRILMERMLAEQVAMQVQSAQLNRTKLEYDKQSVQKNLSE